MSAGSCWWRGRQTIAAFAAEPIHRYFPTWANGQAANASYRWNAERGGFVAEANEVLTFDGARIEEMTAFIGRNRRSSSSAGL